MNKFWMKLYKNISGVRIKGSIMDISISDYIKIKNNIDSTIDIKTEIDNLFRI
jgi:hypothetical protein